MKNERNPGLWWQLSWRLSCVFTFVVGLVIIGICIYGTTRMSPNIGLTHRLAEAINGSVTKSDGTLILKPENGLDDLRAVIPDVWFYAVDGSGRNVTYGMVPTDYQSLLPQVHLIREADMRGSGDAGTSASVDTYETGVGELRVLYGGTTTRLDSFVTLLKGTSRIYVPLLAIAFPALLITVPVIVRTAMRGLGDVVRKAQEIDPRHPGTRLPLRDVPREILPLVSSFNSVLERLEQQFQMRQRFLIDAAHEIRTPIAILQTRIEAMSPDQEQRRLMHDVARLGAVAEQLLAFERKDQAVARKEPMDLVELGRNVVADLAPMAINAGYEISFESSVDSIVINGNPDEMGRAVGNLVRNCIDHGRGSGNIVVSVDEDHRVLVSDDGPGIPEEHRSRVFEPFYRVSPSSLGAGLGLSLVKKIADDHGGEVSIESNSEGTAVMMKFNAFE